MKAATTEPLDAAGDVETAPAAERPRRGRPPKQRTEAAPSEARPTGRPSKQAALTKTLADQYVLVGSLLMFVAPSTGMAMITHAEGCATALASWAATNPKIARALESALTGAGLVSVVAAHAPIALAAVSDMQRRRSTDTGNDLDDAAGAGDLGAMLGAMFATSND